MKYLSIRLLAVSIALALVTLSASVSASSAFHDEQGQQKSNPQKPAEPAQKEQDQQGDVVKLTADLVTLDVTVVDAANKPVMNLTENMFQVFEDKVPQKIAFFSREEVPVSLVFAIDSSGSMRPKLDTVIKASVNLVKESRQGDEIAVIEFRDQAEILEEFTTDINSVIDTLQGLVARGQTAMLDALYLAAEEAHKSGKNRRKAVIVVTDGVDKDSYYKFDEVVDHLREMDVQVYLIGFTQDLEESGGLFRKSQKEKAEELLRKLASETGGQAFFPKELSEVHTVAKQISTDLRTQYAIGYYPTNTKRDGTFRTVKVQVNGGGDRRLVARTRNGYTAPKEGDQRPGPNK
ncbi:MAG TPA: VWA domain-containing protein [Blastocatellia bacterium]|nr:VWA domain-containing protein [Blastocatellia bacterium]